MSSSQTHEQSETLMESGSLTADKLRDSDTGTGTSSQVEVRRGMMVLTNEGQAVGRVAAVVLDQEQQKVTHILLLRERQLLAYCLVPVELIKQVGEEEVLLHIFQPVVESLPIWHGA